MHAAKMKIPRKYVRKIFVSNYSDLVTAGEGGRRQQFKLHAKFGLLTINKQAANYTLHTKDVGKLPVGH